MMQEKQKKIAVLGDLTGYGRCALTVSLPLLSATGLQACPVPTAILSNHTGFPSFFMQDLTDSLPAYFAEWKRLSLDFDGILTGFLGSERQVDLVISFLNDFHKEHTTLIIDPVMGDNGRAYQTFTAAHCQEMKRLAALADILTPNLTEACLLTDTAFADHLTDEELLTLSRKWFQTANKPTQKLVITGIVRGDSIGSFYAICENHAITDHGMFLNHKRTGLRCGTGDVFSTLIAADALSGIPFQASVENAGRFVCKCLEASDERQIPLENGVCFEDFLQLRR